MIETNPVTAQFAPMAKNPDDLIPHQLLAEMKPNRIGHRMKLLRMSQGMRPSEISDSLGMERTYWSRFERGNRALTDSFAALLVDRFGVTMDFLVLGRWDKLPFDLAEKMRAAERELAEDPKSKRASSGTK